MKTILLVKRLDYKSGTYLLPNKPYHAEYDTELERWTVHLPNTSTVVVLPKYVKEVVDCELAMA
jgi:hypothetical protein